MSIRRVFLILIFVNFTRTQSKETTCLINGKKALNVVDKRFISFSVDPAMLLTGFNASATMKLAQHLSPAFIRISGPSTEFLQFSGNEREPISFSDDLFNFPITPPMWKSLNYWIKDANLTPVFAINKRNAENTSWDQKSILPLLEVNEKNNFTCYWELGCDDKHKSMEQYQDDLLALKNSLNRHVVVGENSKVVASGVEGCLADRNSEIVPRMFAKLDYLADAVIWQRKIVENIALRSPVPLWLTMPKISRPVTFSSGLLWAKQIGEAAKEGFKVVFRKPRLHELSNETPVYWVSTIFKNLMGRNVLEVKSNSLPVPNIKIYAHCTRQQDSNSKLGAVTVFVVNDNDSEHTTFLRIASSHPRSVEVLSYILTSDGEDSTTTYLNGNSLSFKSMEEETLKFLPKLRRVRVNRSLSLVSPGKSVAFFVLPGARSPVCVKSEDETQLLINELQQDQDINFSSAFSNENSFEQKEPHRKGLSELQNLMRQELRADEKYYAEKSKDSGESQNVEKEKPNLRHHLINRPKAEKGRSDSTTERPSKNRTIPNHLRKVELELTNDEIKKILKDRAKAVVTIKDIHVTSQEVENLVTDAKINAIKKETPTTVKLNKRKRAAVYDHEIQPSYDLFRNSPRTKRDINMYLLNEKTAHETSPKSKIVNNFDIEGSIRTKPSKELLEESKEKYDKIDFFAEWEKPSEKSVITSEKPSNNKQQPFATKDVLADLVKPVGTEPELKCPQAKYLDERIKFMMGPDDWVSAQDDLKNYHNFHEHLRYQKTANFVPELKEAKDISLPLDETSRHESSHSEKSNMDYINRDSNNGKNQIPSAVSVKSDSKNSQGYENDRNVENRQWNSHTSQKNRGLWNKFVKENEEKVKTMRLQHNNTTWKGLPSATQSSSDIVRPALERINISQERVKHITELEKGKLSESSFLQTDKPLSELASSLPQVKQYTSEISRSSNEAATALSKPSQGIAFSGSFPWETASRLHQTERLLKTTNVSDTGSYGSSRLIKPLFKSGNRTPTPSHSPDSKKSSSASSFLLQTRPSLEMVKPSSTVEQSSSHIENLPNGQFIKNDQKSEKVNSPSVSRIWEMHQTIEVPQNLFKKDTIDHHSNKEFNITDLNTENRVLKETAPSNQEEQVHVWRMNTFLSKNNENPMIEKEARKNIKSVEKETQTTIQGNQNLQENQNTRLENFFCDPKNNFDAYAKTYKPFNSNKERNKRQVSSISKDDIKNYKKFMIEQLRVMRKVSDSTKQDEEVLQKPRSTSVNRTPKLEATLESRNFLPTPSNGVTTKATRSKLRKRLFNKQNTSNQPRNLRKKLERRQKVQEKIKGKKVQQLQDIDNTLKNTRRRRSTFNTKTNEIYEKSAEVKYYRPRVLQRRSWEPQDIVKVKKAPTYSVELLDTRQFQDRTAPFAISKFKRGAGDEVDLGENIIEDVPFRKVQNFQKLLKKYRKEKKLNYNETKSTENNLQGATTTKSSLTTTNTGFRNQNDKLNTRLDQVTTSTALITGEGMTGETTAVTINTEQSSEQLDTVSTSVDVSGAILPSNLVDMIVVAFNRTVSSFANIGEEIAKSFSF